MIRKAAQGLTASLGVLELQFPISSMELLEKHGETAMFWYQEEPVLLNNVLSKDSPQSFESIQTLFEELETLLAKNTEN